MAPDVVEPAAGVAEGLAADAEGAGVVSGGGVLEVFLPQPVASSAASATRPVTLRVFMIQFPFLFLLRLASPRCV